MRKFKITEASRTGFFQVLDETGVQMIDRYGNTEFTLTEASKCLSACVETQCFNEYVASKYKTYAPIDIDKAIELLVKIKINQHG